MDQTPMAPPVQSSARPGPASDTSKLLAALGYPIWIVALIAILIDPYKEEPFVKFHAIQALGFNLALFVVGFVIGFVPFVQLLSPLVGLAWIVLAIVYAVKAWGGEYAEMPVVYDLVKGYIK